MHAHKADGQEEGSAPPSEPSSKTMARLRLMRLGMRRSTASTAARRCASECDAALPSKSRHASSSMTASSLASGCDSRRLRNALSYTLQEGKPELSANHS